MEIQKLDLGDPSTWDNARIIDQFICDVLMPIHTESMRALDIYEVFKDYCDQMEFGLPCAITQFGRYMSKRFQKRLINGYTEYFCEVKKELIS